MKFQTLQQIAITLSIVIVLNIFFNYGISVFISEPEFDDFCTKGYIEYQTKEDCEVNDGIWVPSPKMEENIPSGYCNANERCNAMYKTVRGEYNMSTFTILLVLGLLSLIVGFYWVKVSAVSLGLVYGGILSILISAMRSWSDIGEIQRFFLIGLVLAVIIFIGYKKTDK